MTRQILRQVFRIESVQSLGVTSKGQVVRGQQLYLKIFGDFVTSGLAARLGGNATLVLIALGLHSRVLGDPYYPNAEEELNFLVQLGIVSENDRGLLFTFVGAETLADELKLNPETVRNSLRKLIDAGIIERRSTARVRFPNGRFGSDVYIIRPESHIARFDSRTQHGNSALEPAREFRTGDDQRGNSALGFSEESLHPARNSRANAELTIEAESATNNNKYYEKDEEKEDFVNQIAQMFAEITGVSNYTPTDKEVHQIQTLRREGFSHEDFERGIQQAFEEAQKLGRTINLSYCIPVVRRQRRVPHPTSDLMTLAGGDPEVYELLGLIQACNPNLQLSTLDVEAWLAVGRHYADLAQQLGLTPVKLLKEAILAGVGAQANRDGYFNTTLVRRILEGWRDVPSTSHAPPRTLTPAGGKGNGNNAGGNGNGAVTKYPNDNWRFGGGQ